MAGIEEATLLGNFLGEYADRIARKAARQLKYELDEALSRAGRKTAVPSSLPELASLLLERGDAAPRLWAESVRHHGGAYFEQRRDISDLIREFRTLQAAVVDEWQRRSGPMPGAVYVLLNECVSEGAAAAATDYVRRLRGEQVEFRESALIETILAHLDEGILLIEADGTLSLATRPAVELLGGGLEELLGRPLADDGMRGLLAATEARAMDGTPLAPESLPATLALRDGVAPGPMLVQVRHGADARVLELNTIVIWHEDERGADRTRDRQDVRGVIATVRDRTEDIRKTEELRSAHRELTELHTRLLQRSRAQAMGELATGAAHALNNLLNSMHLRLRLLRERPGPEQIEALGRAINDIAKLVARLQEFSSQRPSGPVGPTELDALIREALALVRPEGHRSGEGVIHLRASLDAPCPVRANGAELREIFVSLLLFARDHLAAGGELVIETGPEREGAGTACRVVYRPERAAVTGSEPRLESFLDFELPASLALTLSSAREVIGRWGGALEARTLENGGAELLLRFASAQVPASERESTPVAPTESRRCVLVVDDDADNASMLAEVLAAEGHRTETATTGQEALAKWQSAPFDCALVDLLMPDMQGTDIAAALLAARPQAKIALVTGWELDAEQRRAAPVQAVFRKPVDLNQLLAFLSPPEADHPVTHAPA